MGSIPSKNQETQSLNDYSSHTNSVPTRSINNAMVSKLPWKLRLFSMPESRRRDSLHNAMLLNLKSVQEEVELDFEEYKEVLNAHDSIVNYARRKHANGPNLLSYNDDTNVSLVNSCDATIGLRLLLNPGLQSPSRLFASPTRGISLKNSLLSKGSITIKSSDDSILDSLSRQVSVTIVRDDNDAEDEWMPSKDKETEDSILPLFDPCILANFEKAVEDSWQISEGKSSENTASASEMSCSDEDSCYHEDNMKCNPRMHTPQLENASLCDRKPSFSEVFSLINEEKEWSREEYLDKFERICPPGCENKIVIYFTSLRAVRKTFEDGFMLRLILKGLRVHVDERDVWMHSKFRQELTDLMGKVVLVPRLFIMGRYIGGAAEVEVLHEEGILARLVEGLPTNSKSVCTVCADVRFIPCSICRGSHKRISDKDVVECCMECNENGLMMCPLCE